MTEGSIPPVDPGAVGQPTGAPSPTDLPVDPARGEGEETNPPPTQPEQSEEDRDRAEREKFDRYYDERKRKEEEQREVTPANDPGQELNVGTENPTGDTGNAGTGDGNPPSTGESEAQQPQGNQQSQEQQRVRQPGFRNRGRRRYIS